jgi:ketosteroid isomerase-like protein
MSAEQNKLLLKDIFAALAQSDSRPFVAAMADDFRWTMHGGSKWSKIYSGKDNVLNELFPSLRRKMDRITTIAHRLIADGEYVAVEARGANVTKDSQPYNNTYCFVFRIADGKLAEVTEYMDSELAGAVLGDPAS